MECCGQTCGNLQITAPMHIYVSRMNAPSHIYMILKLLSALGFSVQRKLRRRAIAPKKALATQASQQIMLKQGAGFGSTGVYSRGLNTFVGL